MKVINNKKARADGLFTQKRTLINNFPLIIMNCKVSKHIENKQPL